jgi:hypothetical protein
MRGTATDAAGVPLPKEGEAEWQLLTSLARGAIAAPPTDAVQSLVASVRWDAFISLAASHGLLALSAHHLLRADFPIPEDVRERLLDWRRRISIEGLHLAAALGRLVGQMDAAGIPCIPYKGPVLAAQVYGDLTLRHSGDVDLLVRDADFDRAEAVLLDAGFWRARETSPAQQRLLRRSTHEFTFVAAGRPPVELHWRLVQRQFAPLVRHDALWDELTIVQVGPQPVATLTDVDLFVALCLHAAKHAWRKLEWIATLGVLLDADRIDWDRLRLRAGDWRVLRQVMTGAALAHDVLGARVPAGVLAGMAKDRRLGELRRRHADFLRRMHQPRLTELFVSQLQMRDRRRDRLRFVWDSAVRLSPEDIASVSLPAPLSPLYYLLRPVRLAWNAARGGKTG